MSPRYRAIGLALILALLAAAAVWMIRHTPDAEARAQQCPSGGVKVDRAPWEFASSDPITGVCIKAGPNTFSFDKDEDDKCYSVKGIGTTNVTVSGGGTGRDCKAISHVVFYPGKK